MDRYNVADITDWAAEYTSAPDVMALLSDMARDRNMPQADALPVGHPLRAQAEYRQSQLLVRAQSLGYQPVAKEVVATVAKEVAKAGLLGVTGLGETRLGKIADVLPVPETPTRAEKESFAQSKTKQKSRDDGGLQLSLY